MFSDMTKEEREFFKEDLCKQHNIGRIRQLERSLLKTRIVSLTLIFASVISIIIAILGLLNIMEVEYWFMFSGIMVGGMVLIFTLITYVNTTKITKICLDRVIKELSGNKLTYKEYKIYKGYI